jgi:hypothetical protein
MEYKQQWCRNLPRTPVSPKTLAKPYPVTRPLVANRPGHEGAAKISALRGLFLYSLGPAAIRGPDMATGWEGHLIVLAAC